MQEERRVALYISRYAIFSEIDFAIVGATGKVLLIEQKAGLLTETSGGLTKSYPGKEKIQRFFGDILQLVPEVNVTRL